jgi:hypothetical protein
MKLVLIALMLSVGSICYAQEDSRAPQLPPKPYYKISCTSPGATYYYQNVMASGGSMLLWNKGHTGRRPQMVLPAANCTAQLIE